MYTVELLTPLGAITAFFTKELDKKDGGKMTVNFPFVFETRKKAREFLNDKVDSQIFGYRINKFYPYEK